MRPDLVKTLRQESKNRKIDKEIFNVAADKIESLEKLIILLADSNNEWPMLLDDSSEKAISDVIRQSQARIN